MKKLFLFALVIGACRADAQTVDQYLQKIRGNTAELTAFFQQMPKGGDLHNHYTGSVYAETYIDCIVDSNWYVNTNTLKVTKTPADGAIRISDLKASGDWPSYQEKLLQKWSVKDYNGVSYPCDKQFFETFGNFGIASGVRYDVGLLELKNRAKSENVSYIETMFTGIPNHITGLDTSYNTKLEQGLADKDEVAIKKILDREYEAVLKKGASAAAEDFNANVAALHKNLHIDDGDFTMRYQSYVARTQQPADVFKNLILCFISADKSPLIVGVNIVAPENDDVSMRDYWLHMQMFKYMHSKYPNVKYAMHAGELAFGMVKPEEMTWHINAAVHTAGANRIGHGVDLPYEHNSYDLLEYMAKNKIAIEINLYSNEFILKVKNDAHPFTLYNEFNVPIVICTDDAGVLRSDLTRQYVLLAKRYKDVKYADIKRFVYNSIDYSFIEEDSIKDKIKKQLDEKFATFEREVLATHGK